MTERNVLGSVERLSRSFGGRLHAGRQMVAAKVDTANRSRERTLAAINLHAILRDVVDLVLLDPQARRQVSGTRLRLRFDVPGIETGFLVFDNGRASAEPSPDFVTGHIDEVRLAFISPGHFNKMIDGKGMPIPTKGFKHLSFLQGPFSKLADRLEHFLRPSPATRADPEQLRISTVLSTYAAFFALAQIGNYDPVGRLNASRIPNGVVRVDIGGGPTVSLKAEDGHLRAVQGELPGTRAWMTFDSMDTADGILSGQLDSYACIGNGSLAVKGFIPMVDNMNKLLTQVSAYLK